MGIKVMSRRYRSITDGMTPRVYICKSNSVFQENLSCPYFVKVTVSFRINWQGKISGS